MRTYSEFLAYLAESSHWKTKNGLYEVKKELDEETNQGRYLFSLNNEALGVATKTDKGYSCEMPNGKKFLVDEECSTRKLAEMMFKESGRFDVKKISRQGKINKVGL